jgi:hypothetical protein
LIGKEFSNPKGSKPARYSHGDVGFAAETPHDRNGKLFLGPEMTRLAERERGASTTFTEAGP